MIRDNMPTTAIQEKSTAAMETLRSLQELQELAGDLAGEVEDKFRMVCMDRPVPDGPRSKEPIREYPPLFSEMRDMVFNINRSLERIHDVCNRADL